MLHPLGRILVIFFIPMGINAVELIGFLCFAAVVVVILIPSDVLLSKLKKKRVKGDKVLNFMDKLSLSDTQNEFVPRFEKIIEVGNKCKQQALTEYFTSYYGELTLKLLEAKNTMSANNVTNEINNALKDVQKALQDIKDISDRFIGKLFANDICDLQSDIAALGQVSEWDNLKNEF